MASPQLLPRLFLCELNDPGIPGVESLSPFCLKVHRGLKYLGLPYERLYGMPGSFQMLYPTGQVPVMLIGEEAVGDSTNILRRLQQVAGRRFHNFGDARFSAEALLWEELADTSLSGFVMAARFADERNWPRAREVIFAPVPKLMRGFVSGRARARMVKTLVARDVWRAGPEACWTRFTEMLDSLEDRAPENGYWMGVFTVADLGLFAMLHSLRLDITPWQREQVEQRSRLTRYLDRVDEATRGKAAASGAQLLSAAS